jgi:hypothetical protein
MIYKFHGAVFCSCIVTTFNETENQKKGQQNSHPRIGNKLKKGYMHSTFSLHQKQNALCSFNFTTSAQE